MMTILTLVTLREGAEPEWDEVMRERFSAAKERPGWIGGQLCMPADRLDQRLIIGTWETRAHWESWHGDETFAATRERLDGLQAEQPEVSWHEVVLDGAPLAR